MTEIFDVVVIGGGLAGCSAAITLAQQGYNILLLEAKTYPHHKVCGEFLSPLCSEYLDVLGVLDEVKSHQPAVIDHARITASSGVQWEARFPKAGMGISRYVLDDILAKQVVRLGVTLKENAQVVDIKGSLEETFTVHARVRSSPRTFQARMVIAAYGKRSTLDRVMDRPFLKKRLPFVGIKNHFYGESLHHCVELYPFSGGYCGLSDIEDNRINLCLLVRHDVFIRASGGNIPEFIEWMGYKNPALGAWLHDAEPANEHWLSISQVCFARKTPVEQDVLMTGDSAGLIAPLAGDGMEMALHGGQMAAQVAHHFLQGDWSAAQLRQQYTHLWNRTFTARLRFARQLQNIMLNPSLLNVGLHTLNRFPPLGTFIVSKTRDTEIGAFN